MVPRELIVTEQEGRAFVCGHENIEIAITIKVAISQATPDFRAGKFGAGLRSNISKITPSVIEKKMWRLGIANIASYVAYGFIDVTVCNDQIRRAVQIGIEEYTSDSHAVFRYGSHRSQGCYAFFLSFPGRSHYADH